MDLFEQIEKLENKIGKLYEEIKKEYCLIDTFSFLPNWEEGPSKEVEKYLLKIGGVPHDLCVEHSGWHGASETWWVPKEHANKRGNFKLPEELK